MSLKKKVFLYGRVSTDQQSGGLESQVRALKEYCAMNKITDYELFTDEGISGTKSSRPALDRMMAAVRNSLPTFSNENSLVSIELLHILPRFK